MADSMFGDIAKELGGVVAPIIEAGVLQQIAPALEQMGHMLERDGALNPSNMTDLLQGVGGGLGGIVEQLVEGATPPPVPQEIELPAVSLDAHVDAAANAPSATGSAATEAPPMPTVVVPELDNAAAQLHDLLAKDPEAIQHLIDAVATGHTDTSPQGGWFTTAHNVEEAANDAAKLEDAATVQLQSASRADQLRGQELMEAAQHRIEEATQLLQQQHDAAADVLRNLGGADGHGGGASAGGAGQGTGGEVGVTMSHDATHATIDALPLDAHADGHEAVHVDHPDAGVPVIEAHAVTDVDATVAEPTVGGVAGKPVGTVRDAARDGVRESAPVAHQTEVVVQTADVSATTDPHSAHDSATSSMIDHSHETREEEPAAEEHVDDTPHVEPPHVEEPAADTHAADATAAHTE
ncbi:MAG: hypothetical protein ABJD07_04355 [Gemmatimonadaceae bacterium]